MFYRKDLSGFLEQKMKKELQNLKKNKFWNNKIKLSEKILKEDEQENISSSQKITKEINFKYRVREDFSNNIVGETGVKPVLITNENKNNIATFFWNNVVETLDYNYYEAKVNDTNLKFYLEVDFSINSTFYSFRIYFEVFKKEKKFKLNGFSFGQLVRTNVSNLKELDIRLEKLLESVFNF